MIDVGLRGAERRLFEEAERFGAFGWGGTCFVRDKHRDVRDAQQ